MLEHYKEKTHKYYKNSKDFTPLSIKKNTDFLNAVLDITHYQVNKCHTYSYLS